MNRLVFSILCLLLPLSLFSQEGTPQVTPALLLTLFEKHGENDPLLKEYIDHFPFQDYSLCKIKQDYYYIDHLPDLIKGVICRGETWEPVVALLLGRYIRPHTTVLDIGGHIGTHTLLHVPSCWSLRAGLCLRTPNQALYGTPY
jgi:hypothetical protein